MSKIVGYLEDVMWIGVLAVAFPLAILAFGIPIVLLVRLVTEILQRL